MKQHIAVLLVAIGSLGIGVAARQQAAQPPPGTEIYLVPLNMDANPALGKDVINVSNSPGYDNQPSFLPDGSALLFSSYRDGKQNDIYRYDVASKKITQLTRTTESEFSPLVTPDKKTFSVIRVEADGAQRLWRFNLDGSNPRLVLADVKPVGYHVWTDDTHLVLFVLGSQGQPATLQYADTTTGKVESIEPRIGRSLFIHPRNGTVTFVSKPQGEHWTVREFDPRTKDVSPLTDTVDENQGEDLAWHPAGALLMTSETKVFARRPGNPNWRPIGNLAASNLGKASRLTVSPDGKWLAIVVAEPAAK